MRDPREQRYRDVDSGEHMGILDVRSKARERRFILALEQLMRALPMFVGLHCHAWTAGTGVSFKKPSVTPAASGDKRSGRDGAVLLAKPPCRRVASPR